MSYKIIRNAIVCPDGVMLESKHRHDYRGHTCKVTGEYFCVDGGKDYFRGSINTVQPTFLHVTTDDPFEVQREAFTWGSYGKNGDDELHYIKLKDMTDEHILAILKTQWKIHNTYVEELLIQEMDYREGK